MLPATNARDVAAIVAVLVALVAGAASIVRFPDKRARSSARVHACATSSSGCPVAGQ